MNSLCCLVEIEPEKYIYENIHLYKYCKCEALPPSNETTAFINLPSFELDAFYHYHYQPIEKKNNSKWVEILIECYIEDHQWKQNDIDPILRGVVLILYNVPMCKGWRKKCGRYCIGLSWSWSFPTQCEIKLTRSKFCLSSLNFLPFVTMNIVFSSDLYIEACSQNWISGVAVAVSDTHSPTPAERNKCFETISALRSVWCTILT